MDITLIPNIKHTDSNTFFLLAGPCSIEGEEMAMRIAEKVLNITDKLEIHLEYGENDKERKMEIKNA